MCHPRVGACQRGVPDDYPKSRWLPAAHKRSICRIPDKIGRKPRGQPVKGNRLLPADTPAQD